MPAKGRLPWVGGVGDCLPAADRAVTDWFSPLECRTQSAAQPENPRDWFAATSRTAPKHPPPCPCREAHHPLSLLRPPPETIRRATDTGRTRKYESWRSLSR